MGNDFHQLNEGRPISAEYAVHGDGSQKRLTSSSLTASGMSRAAHEKALFREPASATSRETHKLLQSMVITAQLQKRSPCGKSIADIEVTLQQAEPAGMDRGMVRVAFEVDGPWHFIRTTWPYPMVPCAGETQSWPHPTVRQWCPSTLQRMAGICLCLLAGWSHS